MAQDMSGSSLSGIASEQRRTTAALERHEVEDDRRFEQSRTDNAEAIRRVYTRLDEIVDRLEKRMEGKFTEFGQKLDGVANQVVSKMAGMETQRAYADGRAAGLEEGKRPSPSRLAAIQGVAGQLATILAALAIGGLGLWINDAVHKSGQSAYHAQH
jgi:hypothetical protein